MGNLLNKDKLKNIGIRTAGTLTIPVVMCAVLLIICAAGGKTLFSSSLLFSNFVSYAAIVMLTTFALSINLGSGRFDFSLGSIATLSAIISAQLSYKMMAGGSGSAFVMLLLCIVVGAILGGISGGLYVLLKLPPIITSLGVTLIYEGVSFVLTGGSYVMSEVRNDSMTNFNNGWYYSFIIIIIALALIYFIFDRTNFGYKYKALREGQNVSVNTGIKEVSNAVWCYVICGALMGTVGFIQAARNTLISSSVLNFGSISIMFTAFLPMFIGGFIGRFSNDKLGYLLAAICMSMLNSVFALFSAEVDATTQSIITAVMLVVFLIFLNNEQLCKDIVTLRIFKKWREKLKNKTDNKKKENA
ncbi:MAG: sugar ABC transporter permease [Clostridia bacterium]|nr:sugar ABC transporter permease [Clostridia bacterium]